MHIYIKINGEQFEILSYQKPGSLREQERFALRNPKSEHADNILNIFRERAHFKKLAYRHKMAVYSWLRRPEGSYCPNGEWYSGKRFFDDFHRLNSEVSTVRWTVRTCPININRITVTNLCQIISLRTASSLQLSLARERRRAKRSVKYHWSKSDKGAKTVNIQLFQKRCQKKSKHPAKIVLMGSFKSVFIAAVKVTFRSAIFSKKTHGYFVGGPTCT